MGPAAIGTIGIMGTIGTISTISALGSMGAIGALLAMLGFGVQSARPPGAWLDAPLTNWNVALKAVPAAAKDADGGLSDPRCKEQVRTANSSEDRLVTGAGWMLVGSRQTFNDVTLVTAMSGTDGMCRPVGYQAFVFVGGTFAGTLSPAPMDSRTDGMVDQIFLTMPDRVMAEFRRYKESDPLCCPSGGSGVSYRIERKGPRPLLVPEQATATATGK